jgi:hypothetical protein
MPARFRAEAHTCILYNYVVPVLVLSSHDKSRPDTGRQDGRSHRNHRACA